MLTHFGHVVHDTKHNRCVILRQCANWPPDSWYEVGADGKTYLLHERDIQFPALPGGWDSSVEPVVDRQDRRGKNFSMSKGMHPLLVSEITFVVRSIWEDPEDPGQIESYSPAETEPGDHLRCLGYAVYMVARGLSQYVADFDLQGATVEPGTVEAASLYRQAVELQTVLTQALEWHVADAS